MSVCVFVCSEVDQLLFLVPISYVSVRNCNERQTGIKFVDFKDLRAHLLGGVEHNVE